MPRRLRRVAVLALALALLILGGAVYSLLPRPSFNTHDPDAAPVPQVVWTFEQPERGAILSTPLLTSEHVYVAAIQDRGLATTGTVYCLARGTGKKVWKFDDGGAMLHMYSSPCLADGRLYLGEGMHANSLCKFYCLDAATGRKLWHHETAGHIESSPCVAGGRVFFGAGDDGLYCLGAATGKPCWHFQEPLHIDTNPTVHEGRLYASSGGSRRFQNTEVFCLNAATGAVIWRRATELSAWGSPVVDGDEVFCGLGNGRMLQSEDRPAGALLCVKAGSGQPCWSYPVRDAVFASPVVQGQRVYFVARDGGCCCLERAAGQLLWREDLGSPMVARPALLGQRLYVIASGGLVCCLDAVSGKRYWTFDVARHSGTRPQLVSSPVVVSEADGGRRIYFGAELKGPVSSAAVLYCLSEPLGLP